MGPIIEFCSSSLASGTQAVREKLEQDPNLDIVEYSCLSFCGPCARGKFALVNGDMVKGRTNEELLENIYKYIEENPML